jgi:uncharacterized protein YecT (DUF1311 family)
MESSRRGLFAGFAGVVGLLLGRRPVQAVVGSAPSIPSTGESPSTTENGRIRQAVTRSEAADRELEEFFQMARGGFSDPDRETLFEREHRDWIALRDRQSELAATVQGGSMSLLAYYTGRERLTLDRLAALEGLRSKGAIPWPYCSH